MRLARFEREGRRNLGVVRDDSVIPIGEDDDMVGLLAGGQEALDQVRQAADRDERPIALSEVRLLAPVDRPPKFIGIGFNSADHVAEGSGPPQTPRVAELLKRRDHLRAAFPNPRFPIMFNKQTSCVTGPYDPIWAPHDTDTLDYEGEVALVIGRRLRRASQEQAREAIAGYTVTNDVSVRDWQQDTPQMWLGKSFETHGPIGPWIVTADAVDEADLRIRTWVNGDLRQDGRLADQLRSPAEIVCVISTICTLEPGDLVATGTPAGVGGATDNFLRAGDRVRIEVAGIGHIENEVVPEPMA